MSHQIQLCTVTFLTEKKYEELNYQPWKKCDQIVNHFRNDDRNKDLEGITINFNNDHISSSRTANQATHRARFRMLENSQLL